MVEDPLEVAADEGAVGQRAERPEADPVADPVADDCAAAGGLELVSVLPERVGPLI